MNFYYISNALFLFLKITDKKILHDFEYKLKNNDQRLTGATEMLQNFEN